MADIIIIFIGILTLIPVYFLVIEKLRRKGFDFDFSYKNLTIIPITSSNKRINSKIAICVYGMDIVNKNTFDTTVKKIELVLKYHRKIFKTYLYNVATGSLLNGDKAVLLNNGIDSIILMKWSNINERIMSKKVLSSGGVFSGSAVFIVEKQISNLEDISELRLVIYDYLGNKSSKIIHIDQSMLTSSQKRFKVMDKEFIQTKSQEIEFLDKNV